MKICKKTAAEIWYAVLESAKRSDSASPDLLANVLIEAAQKITEATANSESDAETISPGSWHE
jgi:hypothetical protein